MLSEETEGGAQIFILAEGVIAASTQRPHGEPGLLPRLSSNEASLPIPRRVALEESYSEPGLPLYCYSSATLPLQQRAAKTTWEASVRYSSYPGGYHSHPVVTKILSHLTSRDTDITSVVIRRNPSPPHHKCGVRRELL